MRNRRQNSGSTSGATISTAITTQKPIQKTAVWLNPVLLERHRLIESGGGHFGVGTNRPVGRNNSVRISTTKETITACDGSSQIAA